MSINLNNNNIHMEISKIFLDNFIWKKLMMLMNDDDGDVVVDDDDDQKFMCKNDY